MKMATNCTALLKSENLGSRVIKALFLGMIFVAAVLLNIKTFQVLLKRKHRNVVIILLLNLTLVSALMVSQIPFNIHTIIEESWIFGERFCQFNGFFNVFFCMNLIFTLLCLTIDRYLAVVKPLKHRTIMSRRAAYRMLLVVYFFSFVIAVIPILGKAPYKYHPGTNHCSPTWKSSCGYAAAATLIGFVLPMVGMLITYTRIFLTLRRKRVLLSHCSASTMSSKGIQDTDSNSLGDFEDFTSSSRHGEPAVKLTGHKDLVHSTNGDLKWNKPADIAMENLGEQETTSKYASTVRGLLTEIYVNSANCEKIDQTSKSTVQEPKPIDGNILADEKDDIKQENCLETGSSELDRDLDHNEDATIPNNNQVAFQNSLQVSPLDIKERGKGRLSIPFPASWKPINALVKRMRKQRAIHHEYKIARTGTILVISFLVLWMPYLIAHSCFVGECRTMTFYNIATFLVYTNALASPMIYVLSNRAVMQDIRKSMGKLCWYK